MNVEDLYNKINLFENKIEKLENQVKYLETKSLQPIPSLEESSANQLKDFLIHNNIEFIAEKAFDDLPRHRFDFYLEYYNLIIEYDGKQHFEPIEYFGGEKAFIERQLKDREKDEYCNNNQINLLRIKYDTTMYEMTSMVINTLAQICHEKEFEKLKNYYILSDEKSQENANNEINQQQNIIDLSTNLNIIENDEFLFKFLSTVELHRQLSINQLFKDYTKHVKAYMNAKPKIALIHFIAKCNEFFKDYELSDMPVQFENDITFVLTNNNYVKLKIDNTVVHRNIISKFVDYLIDKGIFNYEYLPSTLLYFEYREWSQAEIDYPIEPMSANAFNKAIKPHLADLLYIKDDERLIIKNIPADKFNHYLLLKESDFDENNRFKSNIYNKIYVDKIKSTIYINRHNKIDNKTLEGIKSLIVANAKLPKIDRLEIYVYHAIIQLTNSNVIESQLFISSLNLTYDDFKLLMPSEIKQLLIQYKKIEN